MKREFLRFTDLTVRNGNQEQVNDIHVIFREGECHLLWGKDSTGRIFASLFQENGKVLQGRVRMQGKEWKEWTRGMFRGGGIYCVDSDVKWMDSLTLAENLFFLRPNSLRKIWINKKAMRIRTEELFARYGLELKADQEPGSLRAIDKVLVQLVRMVDNGAKMLVIKDLSFICSGQDMERLLRVLGMIREEGVALFIYDRYPEYFLDLADDIFLVQKGTIAKKYYDKAEFLRYREKAEQPENGKPTGNAAEKQSGGSYRFQWTDGAGKEKGFTAFPGEILYLPSNSWEEQQKLYRELMGNGGAEAVFIHEGQTVAYKQLRKLMKYKIGFWGADQIETELFPNLNIRENILMPSVKRISNWGFYKAGEKFIFENADLLEGLDEIEKEGGFTDENIFKILCYRWKLFHPKVLIVHNVLSRSDMEMKRWLSGQFYEMAKRGTILVLLEMSSEAAMELADRAVSLD